MYLDFKTERDQDFLNVYNNILKSHGKNALLIKKEQLIEETINHPAKRFYVSYEQCSRIINALLNGKTVLFKNPLKKEMYLKILEEIKKRQTTQSKTVRQLINEIIYQPAPRFYLTKQSAALLYYQLLKQKQ